VKQAKRKGMQQLTSVMALEGLVRKPRAPVSIAAMNALAKFGALAGSVRQVGDIVSPLENEWEASKD